MKEVTYVYLFILYYLYCNYICFSGQQLAQQMESANPDLIESLRRQMGGNSNDPDPNTN